MWPGARLARRSNPYAQSDGGTKDLVAQPGLSETIYIGLPLGLTHPF